MINFILLVITLILFHVSGYFTYFVFSVLAFARFRLNNIKWLFVVGMVYTWVPLINYLLFGHVYISFDRYLVGQIIITLISFAINIYRKMWRKDIVFTIMEPLFLIIFGTYLSPTMPFASIAMRLLSWIYAYIALQGVLVIIKLIISFDMAKDITGRFNKLKYFVRSLLKIKSSYGLEDLSLLDVNQVINSSGTNIMLKELDFLHQDLESLITSDEATSKKTEKERTNYHKRLAKIVKLNKRLKIK